MEKFSRYCFRGKGRRAVSFVLSIVLMWMVCLPYLPPLQFQAAENRNAVTLTSAHGEFGGEHDCVDIRNWKQGMRIMVKSQMIQQLSVKGRIENTQILEEVGLETEEISEK